MNGFTLFCFFTVVITIVSSSDLACVLGGNRGCEISCLSSIGRVDGTCNEERDCLCGPKLNQTQSAEVGCSATSCHVECINSGNLYGGQCDVNNTCHCINQGKTVAPRSEYLCLLGGNLGCRVNCFMRTQRSGHCSAENICVCGLSATETVQITEGRTFVGSSQTLACALGGNTVCSAKCFWTTGKGEGYCDHQNHCHCRMRPADHHLPGSTGF